jgi:hypothetical protein
MTFASAQGMGVAPRGVYGPAMASLQEGRMRFSQSRAQAASSDHIIKKLFYVHTSTRMSSNSDFPSRRNRLRRRRRSFTT